ncbi:MAG: SRPBCC family protein [Mycobacteriales bacterium]
MTEAGKRVEVTAEIAATPEQVWALIYDPTRMGEWSPECRELAWIGTVEEPEVGARFTGSNRHGWRRWTTHCTIVSYQPGREIGWDVDFAGLRVAHWGYRIEGADGGRTCRLVEEFQDQRGRVTAAMAPAARGVRDVIAHNRGTMAETLERIKAAAEAS